MEILTVIAILFAFNLILFVPIVLLAKFMQKKQLESYELLGKTIGLEYYPPLNNSFFSFLKHFPQLKGKIGDNYPIKISSIARSAGKSSIHYITVDIELKKLNGQKLKLSQENFMLRIGQKIRRKKDIEIRDEEFDKKFILDSENTLFAKALFADTNIQEQILNNIKFKYLGYISIEERLLHFENPINLSKSIKFHEKIKTIIDIMLLIAERADELADNKDIF
jgi:hypothetical protein